MKVDETRSAEESGTGMSTIRTRPRDMCDFCSDPMVEVDHSERAKNFGWVQACAKHMAIWRQPLPDRTLSAPSAESEDK